MRRLAILLFCCSLPAAAQAPAPSPSFEVATIKPSGPVGMKHVGAEVFSGGRIEIGHMTFIQLMSYALDLRDFQIVEGPAWTASDRFDVTAQPPENSVSRRETFAHPSASLDEEQRAMLLNLLVDRFGLRYHIEQRQGLVLMLTLGKGPLHLDSPAHPESNGDSRGGLISRGGGVLTGEAFGDNMTMPALAKRMGRDLGKLVIDQTGLTGSYDFKLDPIDPENRDVFTAEQLMCEHLGLKLTSGKAPIPSAVIEAVHAPTEN